MTAEECLRGNVRLVAIAGALIASTLLLVYFYSLSIHRFESGGPIEEWINVGFQRHRLEQLDAATVLLTDDEYQADLKELLQQENSIVSDSEFPRDRAALLRYKQTRHPLPTLPPVFWVALTASSAVTIAAVSWLHGISCALSDPTGITSEPASPDL